VAGEGTGGFWNVERDTNVIPTHAGIQNRSTCSLGSRLRGNDRTPDMLLAAVHLSPYVSLPLAVALAAVMIWYWVRIGSASVPISRRKIRRFSIAIMFLALPVFVRGLSFLDHQNPADKQQYVMTWTIATFMLFMVVATALIDAINSLRLHQRHQHQAMHAAAAELAEALQRRREMEAGRAPASDDPASPNGHGEGDERFMEKRA
jgi:hypothetical protein